MTTLLAATAFAFALQAAAPPRSRHAAPAPHRQQLAEGWDDLSPAQRDRALRNYQNYMQLPAEKRRDVDQRYEKWKRLPRNDQDRFRRKHDQYRGMGLVDD